MPKKCVKCGIEQESKHYGTIFLTDDGYCSVCNAKYKDRTRISPFFNFKYQTKEDTSNLTHLGTKITKDYLKKQELYNKSPSGAIVATGIEYQKYLKNKNMKIDKFLKG